MGRLAMFLFCFLIYILSEKKEQIDMRFYNRFFIHMNILSPFILNTECLSYIVNDVVRLFLLSSGSAI